MLGIVLNGLAIMFGGLIGILLKKTFEKASMGAFLQVLGVITIMVSVVGLFSSLLEVRVNTIECNNLVIVALCFIIGAFIGQISKLETRMYNLTYDIEQKYGLSNFSEGMINGFIFFAVGGLEIIGPINSVLLHDHGLLITKSIIDFPFAIIFGTIFGIGVIFSAFPVVLLQVIVAVIALNMKTYFTEDLILQLSAIGYIILFCTGLNMVFDKVINIKTLDLTPSILVMPIAYMAIRIWG